MVKFYKSLPATQQYQFGFDQGGDLLSVRADLVRSYEDLSQAWVNHRSEYPVCRAVCHQKYAGLQTTLLSCGDF